VKELRGWARCRHAGPEPSVDEREELLGVQGRERKQANPMPGKGHRVMHADIEALAYGLQTAEWAYVEMNFRNVKR
jgi:hypothetical protein